MRRRLSLPDPYLHAHARYFVDEVAIASARAVRAACRWAIAPRPDGLGADPVHWEAQVGNHASRTVAERVGFVIQSGTFTGRHGHQKWTGKLGG